MAEADQDSKSMMPDVDFVKIVGPHCLHTFQRLEVVEVRRILEEVASGVMVLDGGLDLVAQDLPSIFDLEAVLGGLHDVMLEKLVSQNPYELMLAVEVVEEEL